MREETIMTMRMREVVKRRRMSWAAGVCAFLAIALAQFGGTARAEDITGSGSWGSSGGQGNGTWRLVATKSDTVLTGTLNATGMSDFTQGTVAGSLDSGGVIQFGVVYNDVEEATFVGTLVSSGVSGTYTTKSGDSGTWSGSFTLSP
jgi:hypothetical protein